jgi:DNA mismatch endonuclease, patch repair protein
VEARLKKYLRGGRFNNVGEVRHRTMAAIRGKNNKTTEIALRMAFVRAGLTGWCLHPGLPGTPDFYFPRLRLAIFVDGCFWHSCPRCGHIPKTRSSFWSAKLNRNRERAKSVSKQLAAKKVTVVRLWEHELKSSELISSVLRRIQRRQLRSNIS